jgi:hypothetical protein
MDPENVERVQARLRKRLTHHWRREALRPHSRPLIDRDELEEILRYYRDARAQDPRDQS